MFGGFSATKLKPQLKMAVSRIQIASNKKAALLKQSMREVAILLAEDPPKEEKARIRAEALIRDDNLIEAYEILQLECELLHERIKLIEYSKDCPPDLVPVISTVIWASHRVDIPELVLIRKQFRAKYGAKFEENAMNNVGNILNERVLHKLSVEPPAAYLVQTYLERICEQHQVDWQPSMRLSAEQMIIPMAAPVGYSVGVAQGTGLGPAVGPNPYAMNASSPYHNNNGSYEESSKSNGGIPPPVVTATAVTPMPPPPPTHSVGGGRGGGATLPPSHSAMTMGGSTISTVPHHEEYHEPDIFIPPTPPSSTRFNNNNNNNNNNGSNQGGNNGSNFGGGGGGVSAMGKPSPFSSPGQESFNGGGGGGGAVSPPPPPSAPSPGSGTTTTTTTNQNLNASYADLAARFEKLKK